MSSRAILGLALLTLIAIGVPHRLVFGVLYVVQFSLTAYAAEAGPVRIPAAAYLANSQSSRRHLLETMLLLMTFLLPLNLPALAVWGKNFWIHGQHALPEDRSISSVLPTLIMVMVASFERPLTAAAQARFVAKWGAAFAAVMAFTFAPGRPYLLGPIVNVVFIIASVLMAATVSIRRQ
ncbi:hypothetical protein CC85DRAFT_180757 [Cutaneotrichosporon oleaginosum]|uniref:GPI inositol-deacylase transmembrane domain-containing protein n=1 Tax=Cutaneotrichosporon oleaginosum TaxID=879819 RepID=A0A0J0XFC6_9TREE|nr:uncharacterized protein CC85DRAFT_180757 [Cutaneotrichosporon oleaginosum]KLT39748.1 hypothetical protein CC85DRAFT_180757 [Cutaneotrichosporon oleaginosum]TXT12242.1 hypothetical protein COLE_02652 [Cutaneotrichosporon oleaginosum]